MTTAGRLSDILAPLRAAMYDFSEQSVRDALSQSLSDSAVVHMCHPFGDLTGGDQFYETCLAPLFVAVPDLERRDYIVMEGTDEHGHDWVGCGGYFTGTFVGPWLDIPPTGHLMHMRFHEFYRVAGGKVVEVQAIWDIPEVMVQANAWPLAPSLGREGVAPAPASQDGLDVAARDHAASAASLKLVLDMLTGLSKHPSQGGPEVMELDKYWHPRMTWYGPSGIGTARGIAGFRNWHQIPFLNGLPDREGGVTSDLISHFFAEGNYVAVTGWPNMEMKVTGSGWLGIAPGGQAIKMRSLDFWRVENGLLRENWVLVDLLDVYRQLGVDVFARLREFNKARVPGRIPFPIGAA